MSNNAIPLKDGTTTNDIKLDRLIRFDERSKNYPIRAILRSTLQPKTNSWQGYTTDQGNQGACVGHCVTQEAACMPNPFYGPFASIADLNDVAKEVYYRAQQIDYWPGGEYPGATPVYAGTSVLAGLKAGMELGWWKEYRWALGPGAAAAAQDVILTLSHFGPVMMGTWWYTGMWRPDSAGYLRATGNQEGGHAYLLTKYDAEKDAVYTPNSWGGYGAGWITRADLIKLLAEDGEAAIAIQHEPVIEPEPVKEEMEYKTFSGSKVYHELSHYPTKKGIITSAIDGLRPCKVCKP